MSPERRSRSDDDDVRAVMERFLRDFPDAVLIGGWATYIRTRVAKSHDIDIIVEGVGVDVYPVYQSKLGQWLQIFFVILTATTEKLDRTRILTAEGQFV